MTAPAASTECHRPDLPTDAVRDFVRTQWGIDGAYHAVRSERDQTWHVRDGAGPGVVVKVSPADENAGVVAMQAAALAHIARTDPGLAVPRMLPARDGAAIAWIAAGEATHMVRVLSYVPGAILEHVADRVGDWTATWRAVGGHVARLGLALRGFFHPGAADNRHVWDLSGVDRLAHALDRIGDAATRARVAHVLDRLPDIYTELARCRHQIIHQDGHQGNILVDPADPARVTGVIDFGDMLHGSLVADLVTAADCFQDETTDPLAVLCAVAGGYDAVCALEDAEIDLVFDMACVRLANTVLVAAARAGDAPDWHLGGGVKHARMLDKLHDIGRAAATRALRRACGFPPPARGGDHAALVAERTARLGTIWHFYDTPLHLTRGSGAWLIDATGTRYLDAYNNVPQVGHSQGDVARAIGRAAHALNTNTRYLCEVVADYAARLIALIPPALADRFDVCAFVNSGSEANDVAAQLARWATGRQGALVIDAAYHGITASTAELSPLTAPPSDRVATLEVPDTWRGYTGDGGEAATAAIARLAAQGHRPAFWMVDTALCSNGVVTPPPGWFEAAARAVHATGGMVIADEVQAGLGRMGRFWGFDAAGLASVDVITMGKPVGNGHPLGVVLTRRELWNRFYAANEMFSTFGGNTVACAAGLAVLDVIARDDLIARGAATGADFRARLSALGARHALIGDVRGRGILTGLEFVTDRAAKTPAGAQTRAIVAAMKARGVLVGGSGPGRNVLKLRPSFAWGSDEVTFFLDALAQVLEGL